MREPLLDELLEEPIIRKVMHADGYSAEDIRLLIKQAEARGGNPRKPARREFAHFAAMECCGGAAS